MATKKVADAKVIRVAQPVDPSVVPMDEETLEELEDKFISIRDTFAHANVAMTQYMEHLWGAFTAMRTGTDKKSSMIWLYRAEPGQKGAVPVTRPGTGNAVRFSLTLALKKLNLRPAADRQWNLVPIQQPITGQLPAFILNMRERDSVPRDLKAEETEAAKAKVGQEIAKKSASLKSQMAKEEPDLDEEIDEELDDE